MNDNSADKKTKPLSQRGKRDAVFKALDAIEAEACEARMAIERPLFFGWDEDTLARVEHVEQQCAKIRETFARPDR